MCRLLRWAYMEMPRYLGYQETQYEFLLVRRQFDIRNRCWYVGTLWNKSSIKYIFIQVKD